MKENKGFTIVELVVSFSLMMVVMVYLLRTVIVIGNKQNELLTLQEYTVIETNLLNNIYTDISELSSIDVKFIDDDGKILIDGVGGYIEFDRENNYIIYNDIIYELPAGVEIDKNSYSIEKIQDSTMLSSYNTFYVAKINLIINDEAKTIKIVHQVYDENCKVSLVVGDNTYSQTGKGSIIFDVSNIDMSGYTNIVCNNGATPVLDGGILKVNNVVVDTTCKMSSTY